MNQADQSSVLAPRTILPNVATHRTFSAPQLHMAMQGQGAPVVLSHALGLDLTMWNAFASRLSKGALGERYHVLRYDHRGHGQSETPPGPYTMDDLVDDAARALREWGRWPVVWIGLSMGAMVGLGLAIRHPELVSSLVLANTTARYPEAAASGWAQRIATVQANGMAAVADLVVQRYLHAEFRDLNPAVAQGIHKVILGDSTQGYAASCHAVANVDWQDRLQQVQCPTLVISGGLDAGAPPAMGQAIADRIKGARMQVIELASHLSVIERPADFEHVVGEFLQGHSST
jgi:3-oxoadipate enol-lactonase